MKIINILFAMAALALSATASALDVKPYTEANFAKAQAEGKATAVHFHADWCPTCKRQAASIETLKSDKALDVTIFVANYDSESPLKKKLGVNAQSTFVVYKGTTEKGRMAGGTSPEAIKLVLQKAL